MYFSQRLENTRNPAFLVNYSFFVLDIYVLSFVKLIIYYLLTFNDLYFFNEKFQTIYK